MNSFQATPEMDVAVTHQLGHFRLIKAAKIPARLVSFAITAAAGFSAMVPAILQGIPAHNDLPNHLRLALPFYSAIRAHLWHPGWAFEVNHGYGDPSLRFYPPGLYYLLAATRTLFGDWYSGLLVAFVVLSILGSLGVYFWARGYLTNRLAILAGALYAFVPYRINEFYGASLLSEYAATTALPFAFGFVYRVCKNGKARDIAGLALSYAVLVLSNLPMAVIGSFALAFYGLVCIEKGQYRQSLTQLAMAVALGLGASSFYWVTMVAELQWITTNKELNPNGALAAHYDYRNNFVFSPFNLGNTNSKSPLVLASLCIAVAPLLLLFWRKWKLDRQVKILLALLGVTVFMMTDLSRPIWFVIPKLKEVQFPGRWFAISSLAISILVPAAIPFCRQVLIGKLRPLALLSIGGLLIGLAYSGSRIRDANYLPSSLFASTTRTLFARDSIDHWLPIWVSQRPSQTPDLVQAHDREVSINFWEPQSRSFSVGAGAAGEIRVKTFYYPHWKAFSRGQQLATRPDSDGALLIHLPSDAVTVDIKFVEPTRTHVSTVVSACVALLIGGLSIPTSWRRKK